MTDALLFRLVLLEELAFEVIPLLFQTHASGAVHLVDSTGENWRGIAASGYAGYRSSAYNY